jgi:hypothetical protein
MLDTFNHVLKEVDFRSRRHLAQLVVEEAVQESLAVVYRAIVAVSGDDPQSFLPLEMGKNLFPGQLVAYRVGTFPRRVAKLSAIPCPMQLLRGVRNRLGEDRGQRL